jgi:transposase-like protein
MKLSNAASIVETGAEETLSCYSVPREHWRSIRTNNPLEHINSEIRIRTRVAVFFPDGKSALMLVSARLRYITGKKWGTTRYLNMERLKETEEETGEVRRAPSPFPRPYPSTPPVYKR